MLKQQKEVESKKERSPVPQGRLKLDQGFKSLLRGIRKAMRVCFKNKGLDKGKHHWSDEKWMTNVRSFLESMQIPKVSDFEVAATVLLLYHSFGPSTQSKVNKEHKKANPEKPITKPSLIYEHLGDDGMRLFKLIFENNSKDLVQRFF